MTNERKALDVSENKVISIRNVPGVNFPVQVRFSEDAPADAEASFDGGVTWVSFVGLKKTVEVVMDRYADIFTE